MDRRPGREPGVYQIFDDLLLAVDPDRTTTGEIAECDPVAATIEAQLNAVVHQGLTPEPVPEPLV